MSEMAQKDTMGGAGLYEIYLIIRYLNIEVGTLAQVPICHLCLNKS